MAWFKKRNRVPIFPLSCNPSLCKDELMSIDIFFDHLKHAFKNPRIRNIAITGPYGVGKSSIIKSFNTHHRSPFRKKQSFLYIDLGDYATSTPVMPTGGGYVPSPSSCPCKQAFANEQSETNCKNAIERRLLMQIYASFDPKIFPYSCFRQIPKIPKRRNTLSFTLFTMALLLLLLKSPLAALISGWNPHWEMVGNIRSFVLKYHSTLEVFLYGIVLLGATVLFAQGFRLFVPKIKTSRFALRLTNAELDLEKDACADYLDQYTQELVYCLEQVHKEIDGTVVFEDMDRLSEDVCIEIFTRLREINHILNAHLSGGKYVRFVFVINDKLANKLQLIKFFDYILPVVPSLNKASAEYIFKKNLHQTNQCLEAVFRKEQQLHRYGRFGCLFIEIWKDLPDIFKSLYQTVIQTINVIFGSACTPNTRSNRSDHTSIGYPLRDCFQQMEQVGKDSILLAASPYLTEYRKQYTILNEYALVVRLYHRNNPNRLTCDVLEGILAFIIYKHLWPEDYEQCITGKENVLTGRAVKDSAGDVHQEFLQYLLDSNILNIRCFHYAGFSQDTVNKLWEKKLRAGTTKMRCKQIQEIQADDVSYIDILKGYCQVSPNHPNSCSVEVLAEAIKCILRCKVTETQHENDWFFKDRDVTICLQVLASMDPASCVHFICLCKGPGQDCDIFAKCLRRKVIHTLNGEWDLAMARIFVTGVCRDQLEADELYLINKTVVNLQTLDGLFDASPAGVGD